ncbi:hypothetical protein BI343_18910 [Chromobacterium amazonense]|uniref:hypothetical protein n=1 Tax=Chromobacterium amazonense TaxID=1382803 RepID=UPI0008D900A8|nr:hypothetical protein [Chromobacterium amazonense]OHX15510.1 hypothetical protein BI343_18910 [Chromobacterium amazonense]
MSSQAKQGGLATLFMALTLLALASLVLLAGSRQLVLAHANAQNQQRYHQALNYAEQGLAEGQAALARGESFATRKDKDGHYEVVNTPGLPSGLVKLVSTGFYDGHAVRVQRVFQQSEGGGEDTRDALNIVGDLNMGGDFKVLSDTPVNITVDGKVNIGGSVLNIDTLQSTGSITITGDQTLNTVYANGDISLSNGRYQTVKAGGNLMLTGSAQVDKLARVNGKAEFLNTPGDMAVAQAEIKGDVTVNIGGARFGTLETEGKADILMFDRMQSARALGHLNVQGAGQLDVGITRSTYSSSIPRNISINPMLPIQLPAVPKIVPRKPRIDANDFRLEAHYRFERDAQGILVTVRQVKGIPDGPYRLGKAADSQQPNHLCRELDGVGRCLGGRPSYLICKGHDPNTNDCFEASAPGRWKINGTTMAPGALWFDGDLEIGNGRYHNTFLATGNIATSGNHVSYALNYPYPSKVDICHDADFPDTYPLDYCPGGVFQSRPLGNVALLAGSYHGVTYHGGNIMLGASSQIYGNVWAGNLLQTDGSTAIHGYVAAARQGSDGGQHQWGASTTIDLRSLPESFKPGVDPGQGGNNGGKKALTALPYSWMDSGVGS